MLIRIDDIHLYTNIDWLATNPGDSHEAKDFMDSLGIEYTNLNYADPEQWPEVFSSLRWWDFANIDGFHDFQDFPFLILTEVHDNLSPSRYPRRLYVGLDEIKDSGIAEQYLIGRS